MDTGEHIRASGGEHVHGKQSGDSPALTKLREVLADALASAGLNQTQLARRAKLGRTTVSEALLPGKPVPSAATVAALARVLCLPERELLSLRRTAVAESGTVPAASPGRPIGQQDPAESRTVPADRPGRPIGQWDPHDLEVHPAGPGRVPSDPDTPVLRALPGYVPRAHDEVLGEAVRDAAAGRNRIVVLVGSSSTGKTRACWEAVQPLAKEGWRLWHPFDPTRAEAAVEDLHRVGPHTVVWLNEAQHYLGNPVSGERIAAAVRHLLVSPDRGPVLVLGTLWPEYEKQYTALPRPGAEDQYSQARELLAGRTLIVPEAFDARALATAAVLAESGDRLLADALTRVRTDGRMTQDLAGAPELLNRYQNASPAAKAVLEAAMDARRLGVGLYLPQAFLTDAATDYLDQNEYDQLTDDWAEQAYAELALLVHGKQAPLRRTTPRAPRRPPPTEAPASLAAGPQFRLADYLEQHSRTTRRHLCPPASFWHAAHTHLVDPNDLGNLTEAAEERYRLQWAHHLRHRAAAHGNTTALFRLAAMRERAGDGEGAAALALQVADHSSTEALYSLAMMREQAGDGDGAEVLARQAVNHGDTSVLSCLAEMREEAGDRESAEVLARQAADHGNTDVLYELAKMREEAGDRESAEALLRQAANYGNTDVLVRLAEMREEAGDAESAEALAWQAADHGNTQVLVLLAEMREEAGDRESAEALLRQAADHGNGYALYELAMMQEGAGDRKSAEALLRQAAEHGNSPALYELAEMREEAGDGEGAEALAWQAADHGNTHVLVRLAMMREEAGDREGAEALARQAADHGNTTVMHELAEMREEAGDRKSAEALAWQAADHGNTHVLVRLAMMREEAGDRESAEALLRQAADHGNGPALYELAMMREEAGDREGAAAFALQAADHGTTHVLYRLAKMREEAGDRQSVEALLRQAAVHGNTDVLYHLAAMREEAGDRESAEALARQAADHGNTAALHWLAVMREEAGDRTGAAAFALRAADHGNIYVLVRLAVMREEAGDRQGTEALALQAADHGHTDALYESATLGEVLRSQWPYGLDPDGTPTPPGQPPSAPTVLG